MNPIELAQFIDFIKCDKLHTESFIIGTNQCKLLAYEFIVSADVVYNDCNVLSSSSSIMVKLTGSSIMGRCCHINS